MRYLAVVLCAAGALLAGPAPARAADALPTVKVYRTPSCGCCGKWVEHLETNGFEVQSEIVDDLTAIKSARGVPSRLESCHTAVVGRYTVEGHVPADVIRRLLNEAPDDVVGLAVPGMPVGSPGMEAGDLRQPYNVMSFDAEGDLEVYATR